MEWQKIDTAPKDGTPILIYDTGMMVSIRWDRSKWNLPDFLEMSHAGMEIWPTHWMPLPEPPKKEK